MIYLQGEGIKPEDMTIETWKDMMRVAKARLSRRKYGVKIG